MSFNVLANSLADATHQRSRDPMHLQWSWRGPRILAEIERRACDVVALQEVDEPLFHDVFVPFMTSRGFAGLHKRRTAAELLDGEALFFDASKFRLVQSELLEMRVPGHAVLDRDNVAVVACLERLSDGVRIVVSSSHLLYNPRRGDVKLAQLLRLSETVAAMQRACGAAAVVACGDYNITAGSSLYHIALGQPIDSLALDRRFVSGQEMSGGRHGGRGHGRGAESHGHAPLPREWHGQRLSLELDSAYRGVLGREPRVTAVQRGFADAVDFIFHSRGANVRPIAALAVPHPELLRDMPSPGLPSDHVSLAVVLDIRPHPPRHDHSSESSRSSAPAAAAPSSSSSPGPPEPQEASSI